MIRTVPEDRDGFVAAFARLLAPRPRVYIFRALPGWQFAATEMPGTYQVLLGVSLELWKHVESRIYAQSHTWLTDHVDTQYVHEGSRVRIAIHAKIDDSIVAPDIVIAPQPLAAAVPR